ncbi:MAG: hypothetical protein U0269_25630 [Polyangiales bacterium]
MQPLCPRCGAPLDPSNTRPSHSGAVHPECVRPEDSVPPSPVDSYERAAPKYGGPPIRRYGCALVLFLLLGAIFLLIVWARSR